MRSAASISCWPPAPSPATGTSPPAGQPSALPWCPTASPRQCRRRAEGTAYQSDAFLEEFRGALGAAPAARHQGPYASGQLAGLMAQIDWAVVPSIWWENAPLVVLEAFRHQRPVICGGVGGMAELVRDGVDGLHAPVNDPLGLAREMRRAVETEGLWDTLVAGIRPPLSVPDVARLHLQHYTGALTPAAAA